MAPRPDWLETDLYRVLGVVETASDDEIRTAYRALARSAHPDANPDDPRAEERFKAVTAAYEVLGDAAKRAEYDDVRRLGRAAFAGGRGGFDSGRVTVTVNRDGPTGFGDFGGFGDLGGFGGRWGDIFTGGGLGSDRSSAGRQAPGDRRRGRARSGRDLATEIRLPFVDAVVGTATSIELTSEVACSACDGAGRTAGGQRCATCGGAGRLRRPRRVKVRIPAGVDDGQTIRLPGRGEPGHDGGRSGDLYVTVEVDPHPTFGRVGNNLTITVPVTYPEAVLGADVTVPTLDGESVTVRVPPGTPAGRVLRVPGQGVPKGDRPGDLLLTIDIDVPTNPTPAERDLIERLAATAAARPRARWEATR